MPFCCGKRSAGICVVLGSKKSSTYSSEYASGFFEPAASHLPASPFPRNEGLLGQAPRFRLVRDLGRRVRHGKRAPPHTMNASIQPGSKTPHQILFFHNCPADTTIRVDIQNRSSSSDAVRSLLFGLVFALNVRAEMKGSR